VAVQAFVFRMAVGIIAGEGEGAEGYPAVAFDGAGVESEFGAGGGEGVAGES